MNDAEECAAMLLTAVPLVMRAVRKEFNKRRPKDLTLPQFRAMAFLKCHAGASLCEVAENLGLTPSSTSKLIDDLVHRQLITRKTGMEDRRRAIISLSKTGKSVLEAEFQATQTWLVGRLEGITGVESTALISTMNFLCEHFAASGDIQSLDEHHNENLYVSVKE